MPKVSVLMGVFNCSATLAQALDSLYSQTYQDFNIIICDDGSSDHTLEIAQQYALKHGNIVLLHNEKNQGLNRTLNRCLSVADADYIARMDGDDISLPTRFEKEVRFLDEHPEYAIVSCPMIHFDDNGEFRRGTGGYEPNKYSFIKGTPFCHAPCMVRREAYIKVGGYSESSKLLRVEDYHLWMKMFVEGYRGYNLDECLYAMRDDREAKHRRTWIARRNAVYARWQACKLLKLPLYAYLYSFSPIIKYFVPSKVYDFFHRK